MPHPAQSTSSTVVSTWTTSSALASSTSSTRKPSSPNIFSASPIASPMAEVSLSSLFVEHQQRWRDLWPRWWILGYLTLPSSTRRAQYVHGCSKRSQLQLLKYALEEGGWPWQPASAAKALGNARYVTVGVGQGEPFFGTSVGPVIRGDRVTVRDAGARAVFERHHGDFGENSASCPQMTQK